MELRLWRRVEQLARRIDAANQQHDERVRLFVELRGHHHTGWGEVSPLLQAVGPDPSVNEVIDEFHSRVIDTLCDVSQRDGQIPPWSRIHLLANSSASSKWAFAAVEMAVLDHELVTLNSNLNDYWQVDPTRVPRAATTSLLCFDANWSPPAGTQRVRLKTTSDADPARYVDAIAAWDTAILLDFNGSADSAITVVAQVEALASRVVIDAVEQPFAPGNLMAHAQLASELNVAVSLDESVKSMLDVRSIARYGAAQLVCVKPPRVGGLAVARSILAEAKQLGLRSYVGGFFESPLARAAHAAVAAGFAVEASDVSDVVTADLSLKYAHRPVGVGFYPVGDDLELLCRRQII